MQRVLLFLMALCLVSCGGSTNQVPAEFAELGGSQTAFPDTNAAGLIPVKMQVQESVSLLFKSSSWNRFEDLPAQPIGESRTTSATDPLLKQAASYDAALPHNRISVADPPSATFTPDWNWFSGSDSEGIAFASYRMPLSSALPLPENTVSLSWDKIPHNMENVYIGLAHYGTNRWVWFQLDEDGIVTIPPIDDFLNGAGELLITILVTGNTACELRHIHLGDSELRGTGGLSEEGQTLNPPAIVDNLPASIDLSAGCSPVNDQGYSGACTAFALGDGAYNFELNRLYEEHGWDFYYPQNRISPKYMYIETGIDQGLGCPLQGRYLASAVSWMRDGLATEANAPYGIPQEHDWCNSTWAEGAAADAALLDIEQWSSFNPTLEEGIQRVKSVLAAQQIPVVFQLPIDTEFGEYESGVWNYGGSAVTYHTLLLTGYDDAIGAFKARNSWGSGWGQAGYVWLGYDMFLNATEQQSLWAYTITDEYEQAVADKYCNGAFSLLAPQNLTASVESYSDKVGLSWDPVEGAAAYMIYRDSLDIQKDYSTTNSWSDLTLKDALPHQYWVRAYNPNEVGPLSDWVSGSLAAAPNIIAVSPTLGEQGDSITFVAEQVGSGVISYLWDFNGASNPDVRTESSPLVTLGAPGQYDCSLETTSIFGKDRFYFTLVIVPSGGDTSCQINGVRPLPTVVCTELPIDFHVEYSSIDNFNSTFLWNFGSAGVPDSATAESPVLTPGQPGSYQASVTVTTPGGGSDTLLFNVQVVNPAPGDWSMQGGGPGHEQRSDIIGSDGNFSRWSIPVSQPGLSISYLPSIGIDGSIYTGGYHGKFAAYTYDGMLRWEIDLPNYRSSIPAIGPDGTIYIRSDNHFLFALHPDGTEKWKIPLDNFSSNYISPVVSEDGNIYLLSGFDSIAVYNPDGSDKWRFEFDSSIGRNFCLDQQDNLYAFVKGSGNKYILLQSVDSTGAPSWTYQSDFEFVGAPAVHTDGNIYCAGSENIAVVKPDGTLNWQHNVDKSWYRFVAIAADGSCFITGAGSSAAYWFNADGTGSKKLLLGYGTTFPATIAGDGKAYISCTNGIVFRVLPQGLIDWQYDAGENILSAPIIGQDGTVFVMVNDGSLHAIGN